MRQTAQIVAARPAGGDPTGTRRRRVLLVEDDDDGAALFTSHVERLGHRVTRARTGEDAVRAVAHVPFDLVVVDLLLPGMSGWDLVAALPGQAERPWPIVVCSVLDRHDYPQNVQGVLPKPYTRRQVETLLKQLLPDAPDR